MSTSIEEATPLRLKKSWRALGWNRLDQYMFSEIHQPFWLSMLVYNSIFLIQTLGEVSELSDGKFEIPARIILIYFAGALPTILFLTTPLSFLFASLAAVGRMSADSEIIAPQSLGLSFWRMNRPILAYGLMLSLFLFMLNNFIGPKINAVWQLHYRDFVENVAMPTITPGVITPLSGASVLYVDRVEGGQLADLMFINRSGDEEEILFANRASLYSDRTIELFDAYTLQLRPANKEEAVGMFQSTYLQRQAPTPSLNAGVAGGMRDAITTPEFYKLLDTPEGRADLELQTDFYRRIFSPWICLVFSVFAVPMAARHSRLRKGSRFGVSLLMIGLFFALDKLARDAAEEGDIAPALAIALPLLLFLALGIFLQFGKNYGWNRRIERHLDRLYAWFGRGFRKVYRLIRVRRRRQDFENNRRSNDDEMVQTFVFPSKLDFYVTRSLLGIYFLVQTSLILLLMLVEYTQISKTVQKNDIGADLVIRYLALKIPEAVNLSLFLCLLIAVLILFAMMSRSQEVTVIRAGGGGLQRLCLPLVVVGILASGLAYYMENTFVPQSNKAAIALRNRIKDRKEPLFSRDVWIKRPNGEILNYRFFDPKTNALRGVRLYRTPLNGESEVVRYDLPNLTFTGVWVAEANGERWRFKLGDDDFSFKPEPVSIGSQFDLQLDLEDLSQKRRRASEFSIGELKEYLDYLQSLGYDDSLYRTELYAKFARPLAPFILMLMAMPLGFQFGRRGSFYGVAAGLISGLVFFGLFELCKAFGASGLLAPIAAGWTIIALFGIVAVYRFINLE